MAMDPRRRQKKLEERCGPDGFHDLLPLGLADALKSIE